MRGTRVQRGRAALCFGIYWWVAVDVVVHCKRIQINSDANLDGTIAAAEQGIANLQTAHYFSRFSLQKILV